MNLKKYGKSKGTFRKLKFIAEADSAFSEFDPIIRKQLPFLMMEMPYLLYGTIKIRMVVNEVPLERYVAAVVESEIGDRKEAEFLKACSDPCKNICDESLGSSFRGRLFLLRRNTLPAYNQEARF